jgi:hypothetical protein
MKNTLQTILLIMGVVLLSFENAFAAGPALSVPEPSTLILFATGLVGVGLFRKRKK